ncbi:MAG: antibiotic biosynthesis monooxygenase [Deferrisomatales bacterium]|nr:antibiotic biosynthesis monooxygenase [Deferrisomatales bacterium]
MVRVLIERHIAGGMVEEFQLALRNLRLGAAPREGYISGESLHDAADPHHFYVISTWHSAAAWRAWQNSDSRRAVMAAIGPMLEEPEKITVLEPV